MRITLQFVLLCFICCLTQAQEIRVGVFGLFHTHEFKLAPVAGSAVVVHIGDKSLVLEKSSGIASVQFAIEGSQIVTSAGAQTLRAKQISVTSREGSTADFILMIPGRITRQYHGSLVICLNSGVLTAVVSMDLETAVASVVGAESTPDVPIEALKAQAVAARSYYVAGKGRHHGFDFCDTTHCQLLREPTLESSRVREAVSSTRGLVLVYQSQPFAAMYTRSCSGHTRTAADRGLPPGVYPYYSVECKQCQQNPFRWQRHIATSDALQLHSSNEASRLTVVRRLGWNTIPGDDFTMEKTGDQTILRGIGMGHGIGLCQAGAAAMARKGASFREILAHYYPNTSLAGLNTTAVNVINGTRR
ncbi:MAG TPA: SpoIID/LytB domain-containing protein [Terriglobales bacterium]|nr:SpoIID/LytB domain-containing protein [Terriglobales bacterium]